MIEEKFLVAAVNIRRTYLNLMNSMDKYKLKAENCLKKLESTYNDLEKIQKNLDDPKYRNLDPDGSNSVSKILEIIQSIEDEGKSLEKMTEPLNKNIEKLALEEQELYRQICLYHPDLSEDDIVISVGNRLKKENLS